MDCCIAPLNPANNLFPPFLSPHVQTPNLRPYRRIPRKQRTTTGALHHMPSKLTSPCLLPLKHNVVSIATMAESARQVLKGTLNRSE